MKKKLLLLLAVIMLFSVLAVSVSATDIAVATKKVYIYINEVDEDADIEKITYKVDGETVTVNAEGKSSRTNYATLLIPKNAEFIGVTADGIEYTYKVSTNSSSVFKLYRNGFTKLVNQVKNDIRATFIEEDRWKLFTNGLLVTVEITVGALLIGIVLGFLVAAVRATYDTTGKAKFLNWICKIYLGLIRGTPVVVQLMIMYFVILASIRNGIFAAILAFGINSGAYVAEIVRSGIMSIDKGQMEAGRSLGFNYVQTMWHIILPQAFKNILPALGNEFIALVKETSVAGYVALADITKAGDVVRSVTYSAFFPLIVVALIYLVIVIGLTKIMNMIERKLRSSDH